MRREANMLLAESSALEVYLYTLGQKWIKLNEVLAS